MEFQVKNANAAKSHPNVAKMPTAAEVRVFKLCDQAASTYGVVSQIAQELLDGKTEARVIGLWIAKQGDNDARAKSVYQQIQNAVIRLSKEKLSFGKRKVKDGEFGGWEYGIHDKKGRSTKGKTSKTAAAQPEGEAKMGRPVTEDAVIAWMHNYLKDCPVSKGKEFAGKVMAKLQEFKLI